MATRTGDLNAGAGAGERARERSRERATRRTFTETKAGIKTTEFILAIVAIAGILVAAYLDAANLGAEEGWRLATAVVVAYIVSRGLSKLGTREPYTD